MSVLLYNDDSSSFDDDEEDDDSAATPTTPRSLSDGSTKNLFFEVKRLRDLSRSLGRDVGRVRADLCKSFVPSAKRLALHMQNLTSRNPDVFDCEAGLFLEEAVDGLQEVIDLQKAIHSLQGHLQTCEWHLGKTMEKSHTMVGIDHHHHHHHAIRVDGSSSSSRSSSSESLVRGGGSGGVVMVEPLMLREPVSPDDAKSSKEEERDQYFHFDNWSFDASEEDASDRPSSTASRTEDAGHAAEDRSPRTTPDDGSTRSPRKTVMARPPPKALKNPKNPLVQSLRLVRRKKEKTKGLSSGDGYVDEHHSHRSSSTAEWRRWQEMSSVERRALLEAKYQIHEHETRPSRTKTLFEIDMEQKEDLREGRVSIVKRRTTDPARPHHSATKSAGSIPTIDFIQDLRGGHGGDQGEGVDGGGGGDDEEELQDVVVDQDDDDDDGASSMIQRDQSAVEGQDDVHEGVEDAQHRQSGGDSASVVDLPPNIPNAIIGKEHSMKPSCLKETPHTKKQSKKSSSTRKKSITPRGHNKSKDKKSSSSSRGHSSSKSKKSRSSRGSRSSLRTAPKG